MRCPAVFELPRTHDRNTTLQPPSAGDSLPGDPNTVRTKRALGVDADSTSFTSMGKGLGHGGEATYPLIGEIYALPNDQGVTVEKNRTAF